MNASTPAPAVAVNISPMSAFLWSVRREIWETRAIFWAPLLAGAVCVVGAAVAFADLPDALRAAAALDAAKRHEAIEQPYTAAALLMMFSTIVVALFYCLDALYGERRDRSVLFWKSLPVSDLTTVLAKATIPIVVLPIVTFVVSFAVHVIMLLMAAIRLLASDVSVAVVWNELSFARMSALLFYHLLALHGIWYAPFYGWLLLVSAWARRAPFLWAVLPPLAIGLGERVAFNTRHFANLLAHRFAGPAPEHGRGSEANEMTIEAMTGIMPGEFLFEPGLWVGLAITAVFLALAVRLRKIQEPI